MLLFLIINSFYGPYHMMWKNSKLWWVHKFGPTNKIPGPRPKPFISNLISITELPSHFAIIEIISYWTSFQVSLWRVKFSLSVLHRVPFFWKAIYQIKMFLHHAELPSSKIMCLKVYLAHAIHQRGKDVHLNFWKIIRTNGKIWTFSFFFLIRARYELNNHRSWFLILV